MTLHTCSSCGATFNGYANSRYCQRPECQRRERSEINRAYRERRSNDVEIQPKFGPAYHEHIIELSRELQRETRARP